MLEEMPAGTLEAWWQYYQCQPWGDDWERSSMVAAQLTNCIMAMGASFGRGSKPEWLEQDAFVPWRQADAVAEDKQKGIEAAYSIEGL